MKTLFFIVIVMISALSYFFSCIDSCHAQCEPTTTTTNTNIPATTSENIAVTYEPENGLITLLQIIGQEDPLAKAILGMSLQDLISAAAGRIPEDLVKAWRESLEQRMSRHDHRPASPPPPIENDYGA
jgi:hypothetical protein